MYLKYWELTQSIFDFKLNEYEEIVEKFYGYMVLLQNFFWMVALGIRFISSQNSLWSMEAYY